MSTVADTKLTQENKFNEQYYLVHPVSNPEYKYSKVVPITEQKITLEANGSQDVVFRITTAPFNPAKSFLSFDFVTTGTVAVENQNICMNLDTFPFIDSVNAITESGVPIINKLQYVPQYLKVMNPRQTSLKEYLQNDDSTLFYPSNELVSDNKAPARADGKEANSYTNYLENKHILKSAGATGSTLSKDGVCLSFSSLKNTFLSIDKTIQLPEILELTFSMGFVRRFLWVNPANPTAYGGNVTVSNLAIYLAVENNPTNVSSVQSLLSTGYTIHLPTVDASKRSEQKNTENVQTLDISRAKGTKLRKIYICPFVSGETTGANYLSNAITPGTTIVKYYTQFDNQRRTNFDIETKSNMDYKLYRKLHPVGDDAILSKDYFYYNYAILDEFDGGLPVNNNVTAGKVIENQQHIFDCHMTTADLPFEIYRFIIYERTLQVSKDGVKLI